MPEESRKWWITGVSSGLGQAIATAALARGDMVAGTVRRKADLEVFEALAPGRALGFLLDVTDSAAVRKTAAIIEERTGGIDILVNNAGYGLIGAIEEASVEEIRAQFDVNVFGAVGVIQAALPFMRKRRAGHILNVTSVSGLAPWMGTGIYGATKYALECIGQTLAEEVRPLGIKVTNVAPGGLRTDFATRSLAVCKTEIADYEPTAHLARNILSSHGGNEGGDPVKAALAVLKVVDAEEPPLHLLLGADALHYVGRKLGAFHAEIADWAPVTLSIGYDEN
ncbi:short-chain dehydrogenase/reductase SDR [Parvibaculum lavamentivorans DS-1]|uniref:Short-chain dehydrogenase/reductase SDR n=1 Tax=Parvibaculum lavamentivorans (strain DS-1 / DSM 13023 / NCIMB 13966) TaxID=402881 RepID=A7HRS7_PARL1|nr:oxidoreductase [Parvibaculum lavamentivorans]ABS62610.1 short-chain dehydrogenase/reductase SDR [Parvibaculum lavamentivorans DS-1]